MRGQGGKLICFLALPWGVSSLILPGAQGSAGRSSAGRSSSASSRAFKAISPQQPMRLARSKAPSCSHSVLSKRLPRSGYHAPVLGYCPRALRLWGLVFWGVFCSERGSSNSAGFPVVGPVRCRRWITRALCLMGETRFILRGALDALTRVRDPDRASNTVRKSNWLDFLSLGGRR